MASLSLQQPTLARKLRSAPTTKQRIRPTRKPRVRLTVDTMFDHSDPTFSSLELRAKSEETPVNAIQNSFFIVAASSMHMVVAAVAVVALVVHRRVNSGSVWTPGSSTSRS
jgi:hypothetical protein